MKTQEAARAVAETLSIHDLGGLHDLVGPLRMAQEAMFQRLLRIEQLERSLRGVLEVCASQDLHGFGALDDAADLLGSKAFEPQGDRRKELKAAIVKAITPVVWGTDEPIRPETGGACDHWLIPARHMDAANMLDEIASLAIDALDTSLSE